MAVAQGKAPEKIFGVTDTNAPIGDNGSLGVPTATKTMRGIGTKIDFVMTLCDIERLGQSPGAGTKAPNVFDAAAPSHDRKTSPRLDCPNENQTITRTALYQNVQHPMDAVVKIDVGRARLIALNEHACARALEGVTRFVAFDQVGFCLNDKAGAFPPNELGADQVCGAKEWINLEENIGQHACKIAALLYGR